MIDLPTPFFVLAPMDDVTDTVFRQIIADCAPPDLFFTEFVNVDALQSKGREATLPRLRFTDKERPIIAQLWGLNPDNFRISAAEIADMGFDGVDINFGCPDKNVVRNGACSAFILPANRAGALEIIQAVREGAPALPLSVKTRLGFNDVDMTWHEFLLSQKLNMLTIHGRTKKQLSNAPADWEAIADIRKLSDRISPASATSYVKTSKVKKASAGRPSTLIIGNGDVLTRAQGSKLAAQYSLDGIMIGRGVFRDPFVFATKSPWSDYTKQQKIDLYRKHAELFAKTWRNGERKVQTLNKFCKVYINGFDGAKELRDKLMKTKSTDELQRLLKA